MSKLNSCDYCKLRLIKSKAHKEGLKVRTKKVKAECGGVDVFVDGNFVIWLMELTKKCVCSKQS